MSGFCLKCWNRLNRSELKENDVILSKDLYFCKGCEKMKNIVLRYKGIKWWLSMFK